MPHRCYDSLVELRAALMVALVAIGGIIICLLHEKHLVEPIIFSSDQNVIIFFGFRFVFKAKITIAPVIHTHNLAFRKEQVMPFFHDFSKKRFDAINIA